MSSNLIALIEQIDLFQEGVTSLDELRRWFTPFQCAFEPEWPEEGIEPPLDPEADSKALFWQLIWLFEDDSYTVEQHRLLAGKVARLVRAVPSPDSRLNLLPLLRLEHKLCEVVDKHLQGIISRAGFLSVVSKHFTFDEARDWLTAASPGSLTDLCTRLKADDYLGVEQLLSRPSA